MEINLGLNINCSLIMQKIKEKNSNNCPNTNGDQNSLIESYLDQYGVNLFLNNTFEKFPIKTTKISRQAIILFIFLAVVFNSAKLINLDFSVPMLSLYGLLGIIFLDVIPRNSSHLGYFKRFIFTEEKNRIFIDNICTYQNNEIPREISLRNFSSSSINYFLEKIKCDPKKYHEYIIESFLRLTRLSPENLDLVFTAEILMHLRESFIINLLIKYRNQLSQNNITIYYNFFKLNDKMIRLLFATQNQSEFLYKLERDSLQLKQYYENFQLNKTVDFIKFDKKLPTRT